MQYYNFTDNGNLAKYYHDFNLFVKGVSNHRGILIWADLNQK